MIKYGSRDMKARFNLSPLENIREARERVDYFAAFALSVAYIEHYAFYKLKIKDENTAKKIEHRNASTIVRKLLHEDEKRVKLRENIQKVINERDIIVHPKDKIVNKYKYDFRREELLDIAIDCIKILMNYKK